ncbi:DUF1932 domain-containing protein [Paracoccus albus]|uniref:DUF1932 domain-containing protein n=1 Tax=Paracoccus albus TaxID=3017784 RepID=UPI0022F08267|nr:DUF1932 domain-containing protein [Paracoccus albus]WBU59252.1 DUF1932 domain-containing protein [Paracoccus albus]
MTDSKTTKDIQLLVAGYGAAGRAYASGFREAGAGVTAVDPFAVEEVKKEAQTLGISLLKELPGNLGRFDLVIILSPAAASLDIIRQLADRSGVCPILDLTSSAPSVMQQASAILGDRLIDGTVLGAVGLGGLATPMVFAGRQAKGVATMLRRLGCYIACIDGEPGSASALKLLRSLFMKGLEALVVETQLAAAALGQTDGLRIALADLAEVDMPEFLAEMLRTHPKHAGRRTHEIEAAISLMRDAGLTPFMLLAARQLFARTATAGPGPDESPEAALRWLESQFNPHREVANATA